MKPVYVPFSHEICHHYYNDGGCTFCFFKNCKFVSNEEVSIDDMIKDFDSFSEKNLDSIHKYNRLDIAPNGGWFPQIPSDLRNHIYEFVEKEKIETLTYELRATMFNMKKAYKELEIMYSKRFDDKKIIEKKTEEALDDIKKGLDEIMPGHVIYFGLEVANDTDLKILNKGCLIEDYEKAVESVRKKKANIGANILIAPPDIEEPVRKVFESVNYAVNDLGANEIYLFSCIPGKGTKAYNDWKSGKWNPISATAASEVYRIVKEQYPDIYFQYSSMRVFNFHGRHGKHKRKVRPWSDEEKLNERKKVRKISGKVF